MELRSVMPGRGALLCLAFSLAAGAMAAHFGMPLAWVLGPLLVTAIFSMADTRVLAPLAGRRLGQLIIGASVGLNLTATVLTSLIGWLPIMVLATLGSIFIAATLSVGFARATGLDRVTAYFAMMPGGMSEMANIGVAHGARPEPIALSHALRVALVVSIVPPLIILIGQGVDLSAWQEKPLVPAAFIPIVMVCGVCGALAFRWTGFQNPWMIGSLIGVAVLSVSGLVAGRLPIPMVNAGQFLLGIAIGVRFKGDIVRRLALLSVVSMGFTMLLTLLLSAIALAISCAIGVDLSDMVLSLAPGGFAEMVITAQVLHLEVAVVTAFHITRALIINGLAMTFWSWLQRWGYLDAVDRVLSRRSER